MVTVESKRFELDYPEIISNMSWVHYFNLKDISSLDVQSYNPRNSLIKTINMFGRVFNTRIIHGPEHSSCKKVPEATLFPSSWCSFLKAPENFLFHYHKLHLSQIIRVKREFSHPIQTYVWGLNYSIIFLLIVHHLSKQEG